MRWYDWPVPILVADGHTVSNAPDLFRPLPQLFIGVGDRPDSPQGAVSFCNVITAALLSVGVPKEKERVWSDLYPFWSLTAIPCMAVWHLVSLTTNALLLLP